MVQAPKLKRKTRYRAEVLGVAALTLGLACGVIAARMVGLI
jgi:hypothetical protein